MHDQCEKNDKNNKPLVSVVIPTFNRADLIKCSVASVLKQTYRNLEIIIVDDGSTDNTAEVCNKLCAENHNVCYYRLEKNQGPSVARNKGVKKANGEYLAFHDDDDEWHRNKLELQMRKMLSDSSIDMVFSQMARYKDAVLVDIVGDTIHWELICDTFFQRVLLDTYIGAPTILIKKAAFKKIGGFCEDLENLEDWEFSIRAAKDLKIDFIPQPLVDVHIRDHSISYDVNKHARSWVYIFKRYSMMAADRNKYLKRQITHFAATCCERLNLEEREELFSLVSDRLCPDYIKEPLLIEAIVNEHLEKVLGISRVKIIHSQEEMINTLYDRHNRFTDILIKLVRPDAEIEEWLLNRGYKRVSVYGVGKLGKALIDKLSRTEIIIERLIDQKEKKYSGKSIQNLSDFVQNPGETQVIIITPFSEVDAIGNTVLELCDIPWISIEALLDK